MDCEVQVAFIGNVHDVPPGIERGDSGNACVALLRRSAAEFDLSPYRHEVIAEVEMHARYHSANDRHQIGGGEHACIVMDDLVTFLHSVPIGDLIAKTLHRPRDADCTNLCLTHVRLFGTRPHRLLVTVAMRVWYNGAHQTNEKKQTRK